jgi:hypothetical protein
MTLDPIKPYAEMAKSIAIAVALMFCVAIVFMGGRAVGKGQDAKIIAKKDRALLDAAHALAGDARLFLAIDAEAKRRLKAANDAKRAADIAAAVAVDAERAARADLSAYEQRQQQARRNPDCASLQDTHLGKVCGL